MNNKIKILLLLTVVALAGIPQAMAFGSFVTDPPVTAGSRIDGSVSGKCNLCHLNPAGAGTRNQFGNDFLNNGFSFTAIANIDSDGDGFTNAVELAALTFPGNASDHPPPAVISIVPSSLIAVSPNNFAVSVFVDPAGNPTHGVQFDLTFDQGFVRAEIIGGIPNVTQGNFLVQGGATTTFTAAGAANGPVTVSGSINDASNVSTPGNFAVINFITQGLGTSSLNLSNVNVSSPSGGSIPAIVNNGSVTVVNPVFNVNLTVDNATKSTLINTNATYVLTVNNTGNVPDTFNLAPSQNPQGAAIAALNASSITLNAGAIGTVLLNVTNATPGNFVVNVTATSVGDPAVTATVTTNTSVTTEPPVLTEITITPSNASVIVGNTTTFTAAFIDQFGNPFPATVTWSSSNGTVGGINATTGVFTASVAGTTTITATNATTGKFGTTSVTVTTELPVLTEIIVTPATAVLSVGGIQTFNAVPKDQFGNAFPAIVTWNSSNPTVGTINATTGVFTANASGTTTINATNGSIVGNATVTVVIAAINSFTLPVATGSLLGLINASVNVTNSDTTSQNFMVHVSGVDAAGNSLVGNTLVMNLLPGQTANVSVQLPIPQLTPKGDYTLFAAIWKSTDFPAGPQIIVSTVSGKATVV